MSYSSDVIYMKWLISEYKKKLKDKFWEGFHDFIKEELIKCDRQLYLIKEQELCQKLNSTQTTNTISTFLSISQSQILLRNGVTIQGKIIFLVYQELRDL